MRTVPLRSLDGLIVLWGIVACFFLNGGHDLLAAPGDCDKECRMPSTFATYDGTKNTCRQYEFPDCLGCTSGGGCDSNKAKVNGSCQEDKTQPQQVDYNFTCTIYCSTITKNTLYEATTEAKEFKFGASKTNVYKCKVGQVDPPPPPPGGP